MKISKTKVVLIIVFSIILLFIMVSYIKFTKLDIYVQQTNGDVVEQNGVVYEFNSQLTSKFDEGELKIDKVNGRFKGKDFFNTWILGTKIIKLQDFNVKETFLLSNLMLQEVYTKKNNQ
ncbi:MAG TPA: hypothetical protein VIK72_07605 [Clostridiaceae bacterium]